MTPFHLPVALTIGLSQKKPWMAFFISLCHQVSIAALLISEHNLPYQEACKTGQMNLIGESRCRTVTYVDYNLKTPVTIGFLATGGVFDYSELSSYPMALKIHFDFHQLHRTCFFLNHCYSSF